MQMRLTIATSTNPTNDYYGLDALGGDRKTPTNSFAVVIRTFVGSRISLWVTPYPMSNSHLG